MGMDGRQALLICLSSRVAQIKTMMSSFVVALGGIDTQG
jgi:hypothetical protein